MGSIKSFNSLCSLLRNQTTLIAPRLNGLNSSRPYSFFLGASHNFNILSRSQDLRYPVKIVPLYVNIVPDWRSKNVSILMLNSAMYSTSAKPMEKTNSNKETEKSTEGKSPPPPPAGELSKKDKLKQAVRDYGATVIVFHVTMSLMSLGFFYLLVQSGLDVVAILAKIGLSESILQSKVTEEAGKFVFAYAVHKVFAPLRITITLTATPLIVRKLRAMGILKQIATKKN